MGSAIKVMVFRLTRMRHYRCRVVRHPDQAEGKGKGAQDHQRQRTSLTFLHQKLSFLISSDVAVGMGSERKVDGCVEAEQPNSGKSRQQSNND